jgi:2-polyprenyl-3-methyl-5-hydroxy-6-metoxy-1,4-benzoquinol methylase
MESNKILEENIRVHDAESSEYKFLHPEQYNFYQFGILQQHICFINDLVASNDKTFLDLGCGEGFLTIPFLKEGYRCTSVDISQGMLDTLKKKIPVSLSNKTELINEDISKYSKSTYKTFDVIGLSGVLHHLANIDELLVLLPSMLNVGGFLFITHEPLKQDVKPGLKLKLHNLVRIIDETLYKIRIKPDRLNNKYDYNIADYQRQFGGISPIDVAKTLEKNSLNVIAISKYCVRRHASLAFIANNFIGSENTFSIFAYKI